MELDDLKNSWNNISNELKTQQNINPKMIDMITKKKYHSSIRKIIAPEISGTIVCIAAIIFLGIHFGYLNTVYLQVSGIISMAVLAALSVISMLSIRQLNIKPDFTKPHAENLRQFAVQKIQFVKFQKVNVLLCYVLLVMTIILLSRFLNGKDISTNKYFWTFSFAAGYLFLTFYSKWVSKFYSSKLRQAEDLLKELPS